MSVPLPIYIEILISLSGWRYFRGGLLEVSTSWGCHEEDSTFMNKTPVRKHGAMLPLREVKWAHHLGGHGLSSVRLPGYWSQTPQPSELWETCSGGSVALWCIHLTCMYASWVHTCHHVPVKVGTTFGSHFSPSTTQCWGVQFRLSGLVAFILWVS